jgi:hypothetical protein
VAGLRAVAHAEAAVVSAGAVAIAGSRPISGLRTILVAHTHAARFNGADEHNTAQGQERQDDGIQFANYIYLPGKTGL